MKYGNFSLWDWRPWLFLLSAFVLIFWIFLGYGYTQAMAGNSNNLVPVSQTLLGFISVETINQYFYWWILAFLATAFVFGGLLVKIADKMLNKRSLANIADDILLKIPACTDEEIVEHNRNIGIEISPRSAMIAPEILRGASIEVLAENIFWLLYFSSAEIEDLTRRKEYTALHYLADLLLMFWPKKDIESFVRALSKHKEYLGRMFHAALRRRDLELQAKELNKRIDQCCEDELDATRNSATTRYIQSRFDDYNELIAGRSAMIKWLKRQANRISFDRRHKK